MYIIHQSSRLRNVTHSDIHANKSGFIKIGRPSVYLEEAFNRGNNMVVMSVQSQCTINGYIDYLYICIHVCATQIQYLVYNIKTVHVADILMAVHNIIMLALQAL